MHVRTFLPPPPPPSASHFGSSLSVPCLHPRLLQSRFAVFTKERAAAPQQYFAVSQRSTFDGKRAGSESTVTFSARLCQSSELAEEMYGGFHVRLLCATAAFQVLLLAARGDASVPVSCWEENATMLSRGRRSQEEVRFPRLCLSP